MKNLTKEQVYENLKKVQDKIEEIKSSKNAAKHYASGFLFLDNFGVIQDIEETDKLLLAYDHLISYENRIKTAAVSLGLSDYAEGDIKIQGVLVKEWAKDVKTRIFELNEKVMLKRLKKAEELLIKNLSEDQAFTSDMDAVSKQLSGVEL